MVVTVDTNNVKVAVKELLKEEIGVSEATAEKFSGIVEKLIEENGE